jgi:hypothetical protein
MTSVAGWSSCATSADGPEDRLLVVPPDPADLEVAVAAEGAGRSGRDPRSTRTSSSRSVTPCRSMCSSISSLARFSWVEAGTTSAAIREAGHVDGDDTLRALGAAVGTASVVEGEPAVRGTTGQVGVDDGHRGRLLRPPALQPVWAMCSIAFTGVRRSSACLRPRFPGALNTGSSRSHCSSVRSLGYGMSRTVTPRSAHAIGTHPVRRPRGRRRGSRGTTGLLPSQVEAAPEECPANGKAH